MKNLNWKAIGSSTLVYAIGGIVYTVAAYLTMEIIKSIEANKEARKIDLSNEEFIEVKD